jgi:hypothetical protein
MSCERAQETHILISPMSYLIFGKSFALIKVAVDLAEYETPAISCAQHVVQNFVSYLSARQFVVCVISTQ